VISQESIERVKTSANIVEIVSETVKLRRAGMYYSGLCPFHSERSPSFFVRESTNSYTCYGCGASGNVISFVMAMRAMTFPDAVEYLASRCGIELKYESSKRPGPAVDRERLFDVCRRAHVFFRNSLMRIKEGGDEFKKVGEYLRKRGLNADAINEFGIGYSPVQRGALISFLKKQEIGEELMLQTGLVRRGASGDLYELFRGRLLFPIFVDSKRIAGFGGRIIPGVLEPAYEEQSPKYVNSPETPIYQKSRTIFGLPQAMSAVRELGEVYIVEGYMDVVGLAMRGVHNAVACCGTAMTEQHVKRLTGVCNRVHLLFDGDAAGRGAAAKAFSVARNAEVDVTACFLPDGVDPDDFAKQHGDGTGEALRGLPKAELIDVYIDGLLARYGCSENEKPGPNLLGKVCDEASKTLAGVEREVVRSGLVNRAARRLGVESKQLERLIVGFSKGKTPTPEAKPTEARGATVQPPQGKEQSGPRGIESLPRIDLDILRSVMVEKEVLIRELLKTPEMCEGLQPETVRFATVFSELLRESPDDEEHQRLATKELLQSLGPAWIALWKEAYKMVEAGVSMRDLYQESRIAIRRGKLKGLLADCQRELLEGGLEAEDQLRVSERIRTLKNQIDSVARGVDL
jgi:DNA primase catalytic core